MAMIDVEKNSYNTSEEIVKKLEAEQLNLEDTLQTLEAETEDHHREITAYLTGKSVGYYVDKPPENRPLKLVIKGLPKMSDREDVKKI
ncbi:hypothetical protein TNCV_3494721 [Trichonephila clavipes]|nr:hypothetical protein TNCV_3494721 [Trichonephila clavipes]